jgi:hypothetical protein
VDALCDLMLINGVTQYGLLTDFGVLIAALAFLTGDCRQDVRAHGVLNSCRTGDAVFERPLGSQTPP